MPELLAARLRATFGQLQGFVRLHGHVALRTRGQWTTSFRAMRDPSLAYEWANFRYAAAWINSSKSALRSDQVLDPLEVGDDSLKVILLRARWC